MRPSVAPYLTVSPALAAIAYYTTVFGAQQKTIMPAFDGLRIMHCELLINGGSVMLADAFPELGYTRMALPGELVTTSISLEYATGKEVDDVFAKATSLGGKGETSPDQVVLGHAVRDVQRSVRPSLDPERAAFRTAIAAEVYSAAGGAAFLALAAAFVSFLATSRAALAAGDSIFSAMRADLPRRSRR